MSNLMFICMSRLFQTLVCNATVWRRLKNLFDEVIKIQSPTKLKQSTFKKNTVNIAHLHVLAFFERLIFQLYGTNYKWNLLVQYCLVISQSKCDQNIEFHDS